MDPYIGEIRLFAGNFAPQNWALCSGQLLSIQQNTALFSILGTQYGGDGRVTFGLPDLNGNVPIGAGAGPGLTERTIGEMGGSAGVTLTTAEMPAHNHIANGVPDNGSTGSPANAAWAQYNTTSRPAIHAPLYAGAADSAMSPTALSPTGGSQPHNNMQPYLALNYIIALNGMFPPRQ
jgi:microcystin-dependent protein